mmetsp:Transcript_7412/g.6755  ORF Transcript_7412/g.6755 Transcript_7412/m.6755 type:complete len:105 (-) Transcript_7412:46-360(-)
MSAACRETIEETGIKIELKGILRFKLSSEKNKISRLTVVFYGEPSNNKYELKSKPDRESTGAKWATLEELQKLKHTKPGWRRHDLDKWPNYLLQKKTIYPLDLL